MLRIEILPVTNFKEVINVALENEDVVVNNTEILSAKGNNVIET